MKPRLDSWAVVKVVTHSEAADAMSYHMTEIGAVGVFAAQKGEDVGTDCVTLNGYYPPSDAIGHQTIQVRERLNRLKEIGLRIGQGLVSVEVVEDEAWETSWRSYFSPRRFGDKLFVTPSWLAIPEDAPDAVVLLDPGMAFGTGEHESTQLCLDALVARDVTGKSVLDIGCGSGILSIASIKLGAARCRSFDIDDRVIPIARANCDANDVLSRVELSAGTIADIRGRYDMILMNVLAEVIIPELPLLPARLTESGCAVFSGVTQRERDEFQEALDGHGWETAALLTRGTWIAFAAEYRGGETKR